VAAVPAASPAQFARSSLPRGCILQESPCPARSW
jgi:hypothetical protein